MTYRDTWRHGERLATQLIEEIPEPIRVRLTDDPEHTISEEFGLAIERVDRLSPSDCPVAGTYHAQEQLVRIATAMSPRRETFTALHELGHHHLNQSDTAYQLLGPNVNVDDLIEAVCDSFAAQLIIPRNTLEQILGGRFGAGQMIEMFEETDASRAAIAVAVSNYITPPNVVVIADTDRIIRFSASSGLYRVAAGTVQPDDGPIAKALRLGQSRSQGQLTYGTGSRSDTYFYDAVASDGYVFAIFVSGEKPWGGLNITEPTSSVLDTEHTCDACDETFNAWERCPECGSPTCPHCGRCRCRPATARTAICTVCGLQKRQNLIGASGICRDCE